MHDGRDSAGCEFPSDNKLRQVIHQKKWKASFLFPYRHFDAKPIHLFKQSLTFIAGSSGRLSRLRQFVSAAEKLKHETMSHRRVPIRRPTCNILRKNFAWFPCHSWSMLSLPLVPCAMHYFVVYVMKWGNVDASWSSFFILPFFLFIFFFWGNFGRMDDGCHKHTHTPTGIR